MTTINKLMANQHNALRSTGPRTLTGRTRSSKNALRHGLYTAAVVPAAGESVEEFRAFCASVFEEFGPEGIMESRLVERVALILWRFERVMKYETAVAANAIGAREGPLPPDPDTITGAEVELTWRVPEGAPPEYRLALARGRIKGWVPIRAALRIARAALEGGSESEEIPARDLGHVSELIGEILGWKWDEIGPKWDAALAARVSQKPLVGDAFRAFVRELARGAGKNPETVVRDVRKLMTEKVAGYDQAITEKEVEANSLAVQMRAARSAAQASRLYAARDAVERVMRMEAHLTRQLGLTLDLLERVRGNGTQGGDESVGPLIRRIVVGDAPRILPESVGSFRTGGSCEGD